jgi:subtilisin family serine protease
MTRRLILAVLTLAISTSLFASEASVTSNRYMVVMRRTASGTSPRLVANSADAAEHRVRRFENAGSMAMDLTDAEVAELRRSGDVASVEPVIDIYAQSDDAPAEPTISFMRQEMPWGVRAVHADSVWPVTRGTGVNVAIIDSGIDMNHPDLAAAYAGGYNTFDSTKQPIDDYGHGTHVAGIIAAADNTVGTVGIAPGVKVWSVKVLSSDGQGKDENLIAGLDWVIGKKREIGGQWVANMSLGAQGGADALAQAVQRAVDARIILVAAAGNAGREKLLYPAVYEGVISVGAVDSQLKVWSLSSYSLSLSIVAPGVDVPSTYLRDKFPVAEVEAATQLFSGVPMTGSPMATVLAPYLNCGYGRVQDIPSDAAGKICVIERSPAGDEAIPFGDKARNAKEAGAVAVIIYNNDDVNRNDITQWGLVTDGEYDFPLTVSMTFANAQKLLNGIPTLITESYRYREYGPMTGTSMATPHVAGVAALLLALAPNANFAQIESTIQRTAQDIDVKGWDYKSSWGVVDALAAAKMISPGAFTPAGGGGGSGGGGAGQQPSPKRRSTHH